MIKDSYFISGLHFPRDDGHFGLLFYYYLLLFYFRNLKFLLPGPKYKDQAGVKILTSTQCQDQFSIDVQKLIPDRHY
jgi:hypothetical protein